MESREVRVSAPGKVNLSLRVGPVDERGYHPLETVFQAVSLYETVTASAAPEGTLEISVSGRDSELVPCDESNLVSRAARLLQQHCGVAYGARLAIAKTVPVAGGMGGGSADAAAALCALNKLWGLSVSGEELTLLAAQLGADVPFCLHGKTMLGTRYGDVLAPLSAAEPLHWVIVPSSAKLSTPEVYRRFDSMSENAALPEGTGTRAPQVAQGLLSAIAEGDPYRVGELLRNDLQESALALHPPLREVLETLRAGGALGVLVSGSGPTVMALAADREAADSLADFCFAAGLAAIAVQGGVAGPLA
ncbi:4-(cytidine 5'-diphospho)-2-C-methyl-D-erythritol kinase [Dermabacteraceae bacterium TAE3-ERU27]|nr:4-(cytidine 5'-diphospho)-2-C-methyl-D-erythritol kinase [Dermabacteraceae bacterium TAE3-ERU27]